MPVNLYGDDWDRAEAGDVRAPGYGRRALRVGDRLGAERLGASLYELPPGQATWPYHWHHGNEELLVVLSGRPTLRSPEGDRELAPGDSVLFGRGPEGAHKIGNRSDEPARVLIVSTGLSPEVVEYPDSGKVGAGSRFGRLLFPTTAAVDYWEGE